MTGFVAKDNCVVVAPDGHEFPEFSCLFPKLEPFYFSFEKYHEANKHYVFNYLPLKNFLDSYNTLPMVAVSLYAMFCVVGLRIMKDREPFRLRPLLAGWNLFLSVYSALTVLRGLPAFYYLATNPLKDSLCLDPTRLYGGSNDLWIALFILSKFAELFDTVFIVLQKKPLIVLHWWHHISVLLYCWVAYQERTPSGAFFGPVNACVHSIMYFYYFLMAIKMKPKWFNPICITIFQIAQMIMGVFVSVASLYYHLTEKSCVVTSKTMWAAFLMYLSYLLLFGSFFYKRYINNQDLKSKKSK